MALEVGKIRAITSFHKSLFGKDLEHIPDQDELTRKEKEVLIHRGRKGFSDPYKAEDIFDSPTLEDQRLFDDDWVYKIRTGEKPEDYYSDYLISKGFTEERAKEIVLHAIDSAERQKDWAVENEERGKRGSDSMSLAICLGTLGKLLLELDFVPEIVKRGINILYGLFLGKRANDQYSLHGRGDDDLAQNIFEGDYFSDTLPSGIGGVAVTTETKIKPLALPALGLLPTKLKNLTFALMELLSLPNLNYWRVRMFKHINQGFVTDFFKYLWHKLLSLFGIKKSIERVEEIKEKGNLEPGYILTRHYENSGITEKQNQTIPKLISQTFKLVTDTFFSRDTTIKKESSRRLNETIAPLFGLYGLTAVTCGAIGKTILSLTNNESKLLNFASASGVFSQQNIYLPKFVVSLQTEVEDGKNRLSDPAYLQQWSKQEIEDRKELLSRKTKLMYMGYSCFLLNGLNTVLKLKQFDNFIFKKAVSIIDGLSGDLISKFFSERRHLQGFESRIKHPRYYGEKDHTVPIIPPATVRTCPVT